MPVLASLLLSSVSVQAVESCTPVDKKNKPRTVYGILIPQASVKDAPHRVYSIATEQATSRFGDATFTVEADTAPGSTVTLAIKASNLSGRTFFRVYGQSKTVNLSDDDDFGHEYLFWLNPNESCTFQFDSEHVLNGARAGLTT